MADRTASLLVAAAALAAALLVPVMAIAQPRTLVLGTATPGGGFPVYGAALIEALRSVDPELAVEARNTRGSTENVPLLERGAIDLGLVTGEVFHEAVTGIGRPPSGVRAVAAMYAQPGLFVVRADSNHGTIGDLRGTPVVFGAQGSGLVVLARYVLDGIGLSLDADFRPITLERAGDGPAMVLDGRAAALWGAGSGWPGFTAMAKAEGGARFIAPSTAQIAQITAKHAFLRPMTVPAGSYPGQGTPIPSVGTWSLIVARADLDEALVHRFVRALHRAEPVLGRILAQARETTAANTAQAIANPALLHPGAARYLREAGLLR